MPVKQWFRKLQPMQLYIVLAITVAFFLVELVASHVTHALTLLMDSYHMLCNIMALTGCIITIKVGSGSTGSSIEKQIFYQMLLLNRKLFSFRTVVFLTLQDLRVNYDYSLVEFGNGVYKSVFI